MTAWDRFEDRPDGGIVEAVTMSGPVTAWDHDQVPERLRDAVAVTMSGPVTAWDLTALLVAVVIRERP